MPRRRSQARRVRTALGTGIDAMTVSPWIEHFYLAMCGRRGRNALIGTTWARIDEQL